MIVYFGYVYGALTLIGGIMGYIKAHSMASLISGAISGILLLLAAYLLSKGNPLGYWSLFGLTVLLTAFFTPRFLNSHAFMPAGLMLILGVLMIVCLLVFRKGVIPG